MLLILPDQATNAGAGEACIVADWNVNGHALPEQAELLASLGWDVAC